MSCTNSRSWTPKGAGPRPFQPRSGSVSWGWFEVPMLVIFLGAIGGFMMSGFIGLFVGAVVLSLGYEFARTWIDDQLDTPEAAAE